MSARRRRGNGDQLELFDADVSRNGMDEHCMAVVNRRRASTQRLMERIVAPANLNLAYRRVVARRGAAGADAMSVDGLLAWLRDNRGSLIDSLLDGSYQPDVVRAVAIPKPGGGSRRQLAIATVVDRLVQQALLQILDPLLDPTFSPSSFGYRRGKSASQALTQARAYAAAGRSVVVSIDLQAFFTHINHGIMLARVAHHVGDRRVVRVIGRFLGAGVLHHGVCVQPREGVPQGSPLSPLLSNLLLDDLDKELERHGHWFCRYGDDCAIYVESEAEGKRVMTLITAFLKDSLCLRINHTKSAVVAADQHSFLGQPLFSGGPGRDPVGRPTPDA